MEGTVPVPLNGNRYRERITDYGPSCPLKLVPARYTLPERGVLWKRAIAKFGKCGLLLALNFRFVMKPPLRGKDTMAAGRSLQDTSIRPAGSRASPMWG
jgi:hypothetical protein